MDVIIKIGGTDCLHVTKKKETTLVIGVLYVQMCKYDTHGLRGRE